MSVLMIMRIQGDGEKLVAVTKEDPQRLQAISALGKEHGALHHSFWTDGSAIVVVDEWPDEASFQKFFSANTEIPKLMAEVGVTAEPEITFYRKLDTGDDF